MDYMKRALIYTRISDDATGQELGVQRQEKLCRQLADDHGLTVSRVFTDNDTSAFSGKRRPGFEAILSELDSRTTLIAYHPDRLYRHPKDLETVVERVEATRARVLTVAAGDIDMTTASGRMTARILGAVSRQESERNGERVSAAHQQALARGYWRGRVPFGMRVKTTGILEPDPVTAPLVQRAVASILAGGSIHEVSRQWKSLGYVEKHTTGVKRTLASPGIAGLVGKDLRPAMWKGIVSERDWRTLQAWLNDKTRKERYTSPGRISLLGGIPRCAEHGTTMFASGEGSYKGQGACAITVGRELAEDFYSHLIIARLEQPDAALVFTPEPDDGSSRAEIETLESRRASIANMIAKGLLTEADAERQLLEIKREIDSLRVPAPVRHLPMKATPAKTWKAWTVTQRREAIKALCVPLISHQRHGGPPDLSRFSVEWHEVETDRSGLKGDRS